MYRALYNKTSLNQQLLNEICQAMSFSLSDQHRPILLNNVTYRFPAKRKIIDILADIFVNWIQKKMRNIFKYIYFFSISSIIIINYTIHILLSFIIKQHVLFNKDNIIIAKMYDEKQRTWHTCRYKMPDQWKLKSRK